MEPHLGTSQRWFPGPDRLKDTEDTEAGHSVIILSGSLQVRLWMGPGVGVCLEMTQL